MSLQAPLCPSLDTNDVVQLGDAVRLTRVLHVINGEHYSGAERVQDLLALGLPRHGFEVGFVALKPGRFAVSRASGDAQLHELPMAGRWDLRAANRVARIAREGGYRLIHAHTPRSALVGSLAARRARLPLVYHVHSPTSRDSTRRAINLINDRIERWSVASAARLITVSPTLSEHMTALGVPSRRVRCVMNGVPRVQGARARTKPSGDWTLGMVALFRPRKGTEALLEALASLASRGVHVNLRAIGPFETREYQDRLVSHANRLGLSGAVRWTGFTERVHDELAHVDALALPSLFGEGLPMVVLEAMAVGLPVIATRCEGVAQAVAHRETGLLVVPGSVSQLAGAVEELVTGELDYERASAAALQRHAELFSDDVMAARVAGVYRELLA